MGATRWVIGDVHGHHDKAVEVLKGIDVIGDDLEWTGAADQVFFIGDLTDRGPHGLASIDLVMRLQREAAAAGGKVECLMGNHEIFLLGAKMHPDEPLGPSEYTLWELWRANGGVLDDVEGLTDEHLDWLTTLPSVVVTGDDLLIHADSEMYAEFGTEPRDVNAGVGDVLRNRAASEWDGLVHAFVRRNELWDELGSGEKAIRRLLETFGASRIVHGHTPIAMLTQRPANSVIEPLVYSGGRCVNVDGGMFLGGPGFAFSLDK